MSELLYSQIPIARQVDFDAFVKDLMDSNALSIEDAAEEAVETFSSDYDISGLFIYRNKREFDEKVKVETRCKTIEKAGKGTDTFINANFAFQGLVKLLKDSDENVKEGIWHMFNSKRIVNSLIQLLIVQKTDDKKEEIDEIDSDSDEEDEDEAKILQTVAVLDFLIFIIQSAFVSSQHFQDLALFCALDEETVKILRSRLDEDVAESRIVTRMIDFLSLILREKSNQTLFLDASGVEILDLSIKMHKKNNLLVEKIKAVLAVLM